MASKFELEETSNRLFNRIYHAKRPGDLANFLRDLLKYPMLAPEVQKIRLNYTNDIEKDSGVMEMAKAWEANPPTDNNAVCATYKKWFDALKNYKIQNNIGDDGEISRDTYNRFIRSLLEDCVNAEIVWEFS